VLTVHGALKIERAYYYCGRCKQSFIPYDDVLGLVDEISPGLMPLVCLAGTLLPFADAAEDVLKRFSGVRVSTSTVLRCTEAAGERLRAQQKEGRMVAPTQAEPKWTTPREKGAPVAYIGLDAFSVPMQGVGASKAESRMLYTALLYTPDKEHTRYLVDFELDALAEQVRGQARAVGVSQVSELIAVTEAKGILYEQGGEALLAHLRALPLPPRTRAEIREELRKLIGYFENNRHRTDYPTYRRQGWDIGSGPTEAGCKIIGERLKGSGMRWVEDGAATVAALRALYVSSGKLWDGFWAQPHRAAA
jgi:hypothetical protein